MYPEQHTDFDGYDPKLTPQENKLIFDIVGPNGCIGFVGDLDPTTYNEKQMYWVSKGRGTDEYYGNIDDLDPTKYDEGQMFWTSRDRGLALQMDTSAT